MLEMNWKKLTQTILSLSYLNCYNPPGQKPYYDTLAHVNNNDKDGVLKTRAKTKTKKGETPKKKFFIFKGVVTLCCNISMKTLIYIQDYLCKDKDKD